MTFTVAEIAELVGGSPVGEESIVISSVSRPENINDGSIVIAMTEKIISSIPDNVPVMAPVGSLKGRNSGIEVKDIRLAMARLLDLFDEKVTFKAGIDPLASVDSSAVISPEAYIGPFCVVESSAVIGSEAILRANVFVGRGTVIGAGTIIEPGVVLYRGCAVGENSLLHSNCVIGADGFGHIPATKNSNIVKIPQIGGVVIGNNVEIGASTTIDRGTIADTIIGDHSKIDNQVQIGHNVEIGENCMVVAMSGIAGSSVLEDRVIMAARSSLQDHKRIGKGATVAGMAGVTKDVKPGDVVYGFPARNHRDHFRVEALVRKLPDLFKRVKALERDDE